MTITHNVLCSTMHHEVINFVIVTFIKNTKAEKSQVWNVYFTFETKQLHLSRQSLSPYIFLILVRGKS